MLNPIILAGQVTKLAGRGFFIVGIGTLFIMAILGTVAIDIVLLASLLNAVRRDSPLTFVTALLFSQLFENLSPRSVNSGSWPILLFISPVTTAIAVGLSFLLGVPGIGMFLMAGWLVSLTLVCSGQMLSWMGNQIVTLGEFLEELLNSSYEASYNDEHSHDHHCQHNHSQMPRRSAAQDNPSTEPYQQPTGAHRGFFGSGANSSCSQSDLPPPYPESPSNYPI
jgi:hypothetical protein